MCDETRRGPHVVSRNISENRSLSIEVSIQGISTVFEGVLPQIVFGQHMDLFHHCEKRLLECRDIFTRKCCARVVTRAGPSTPEPDRIFERQYSPPA